MKAFVEGGNAAMTDLIERSLGMWLASARWKGERDRRETNRKPGRCWNVATKMRPQSILSPPNIVLRILLQDHMHGSLQRDESVIHPSTASPSSLLLCPRSVMSATVTYFPHSCRPRGPKHEQHADTSRQTCNTSPLHFPLACSTRSKLFFHPMNSESNDKTLGQSSGSRPLWLVAPNNGAMSVCFGCSHLHTQLFSHCADGQRGPDWIVKRFVNRNILVVVPIPLFHEA